VARPPKTRFCRAFDGDHVFKPRQIPMTDLETIRLCDLERLDQSAAGDRMGVSRGTVYRLLKSGRAKVVAAILDSQALLIEKGANDEDLRTHDG